jgi:hypothetical protein
MAIPRLNILLHRELGKKIIKWALEPESRPKTLPEFLRETQGIIEQPIPDWIKGLQFVQSNMEVLLIRLPPTELVQDTLDRIAAGTGKYPLPDFYEEYLLHGQHQSQQELFEYRVGDYTIAHCQ